MLIKKQEHHDAYTSFRMERMCTLQSFLDYKDNLDNSVQ